jgi:hypothetical protein
LSKLHNHTLKGTARSEIGRSFFTWANDQQTNAIILDDPDGAVRASTSQETARQAHAWERINGNPDASFYFNYYTTVFTEGLDPAKNYRIKATGYQKTTPEIHLGDSNAPGYFTDGTTILAIPAGSNSFTTQVWANIPDNASRMFRLILEEVNYGILLVSYNEVASKQSWVDFIAAPPINKGAKQPQKNLKFVESTSVVGEFVSGAVIGTGETWTSFAGELAISLVPYVGAWPDLRDVGVKLWKYQRAGLTPTDQFELSISLLGLVSELGVLTDYFVDAAKLSFKAMRLTINTATNGAGFAAAALAVTPILQHAADLLYDWSLKKLGIGGSHTSDSIVGAGGGVSSGGLMGEGESGVTRIQQLLNNLRTEMSEFPLPKKLEDALEAAIKMMELMEKADASVYEWLGRLKTNLGAEYAEKFAPLLKVVGGDKLADVGKRLEELARNDALKKEFADLGSSALISAIAREVKESGTLLKAALGGYSANELADLLMTIGKTTKDLSADSLLIGDFIRGIFVSGKVARSEMHLYFDDLSSMKNSSDATQTKLIRWLIYNLPILSRERPQRISRKLPASPLFEPSLFTGWAINDGRIVSGGRPLHFPGGRIQERLDFVVGLDGKLHLGHRHAFLAENSGNANFVQAAGTITIKNGVVTSLDNNSEHFMPSLIETLQYRQIFEDLDIHFTSRSNLTVYGVDEHGEVIELLSKKILET